MGFKIACIAVANADAQKLREALGLSLTDDHDEFCESDYCGSEGANNTYVVWKNTGHGDFTKVERASVTGVVDCWTFGVHEGVMSGHVDRIEGGETVWRIEYVGCEDPKTFTTQGVVPAEILEAHQTFKLKNVSEAEDVDYEYEILSTTFARFTGLKYDEMHDDSPFKFFELRQMSPSKKKPFWKIF